MMMPQFEEWVSDNEEEDVSHPKIEKRTVRPSIVEKEFVKSKQQEKTARKNVKQGNLQMDLQEKEVIDNRGYVAFGGNPKRGKITGKDDHRCLVQVYMDDIIFGSTKKDLCNAFEKLMHEKIVGLQEVKTAQLCHQMENSKASVQGGRLVKKVDVHIYRYLKGQPKLGLWYPKDSPFDLVAYTDSDYVGASLDRKSTTRGCQFLGCRLISWKCKKQTVVANSTTEAEYVAASSCCGQMAKEDNHSMKLLVEEVFNYKMQKVLICLQFYIFEPLHLMGLKTTAWNEFSSTMASAIICLATNKKFNFSKYIFESGGPRCQETMGDTTARTRFESVSKHSNDSLLVRGNTLRSDEDRLELDELMKLCTTLQNRVLDLEKTKTSQHNEIVSLKRRVKKLEKKNRSEDNAIDARRNYTWNNDRRTYEAQKKDQISFDEEVALKLQAKFVEQERLAKEKAKKEKVANIALIETWDDIQAKINVDHQLAERLQA
ncbi:hypothetical protein Tco_1507960 [Tanacetum coccineum]